MCSQGSLCKFTLPLCNQSDCRFCQWLVTVLCQLYKDKPQAIIFSNICEMQNTGQSMMAECEHESILFCAVKNSHEQVINLSNIKHGMV